MADPSEISVEIPEILKSCVKNPVNSRFIMLRMRINLQNRACAELVDLCTLGSAYFSMAHAQNGAT